MLTAPEVVAGVDSQQEAQATRLRKHESEKRSQKSATSWTPPSAADHLDFPRWSLKVRERENGDLKHVDLACGSVASVTFATPYYLSRI
jgi:hypothetical protein